MAFDARGYAKRLKKAGIKRKQVRAHVKAMTRYLPPDLATKSDLAAHEQSTAADLLDMEQRIDRRLTWLEQRPEAPIPQTQIPLLALMAATLGILFVLRKLTETDPRQPPQPRRLTSPDRFGPD
ncbi:MAG: hypothetical protein AB7H71_06960 [Alphaproteobacteria bacterium]